MDSGDGFEKIVQEAEDKKLHGHPTGPLPVPSSTSKRRHGEATPSTVAPRPLAPHTDVVEPEESRLNPKGMSATTLPPRSPQSTPLAVRPAPEAERTTTAPRYPPLAQASAPAPLASAQLLTDEPRNLRPQVVQHIGQHVVSPSRTSQPGPRAGYFTDERRDGRPSAPPATSIPQPRPPEVQPAKRQGTAPHSSDASRIESLTTPHLRPRPLAQPPPESHGSHPYHPHSP